MIKILTVAFTLSASLMVQPLSAQSIPEDLATRLQEGGLVIFFRHGVTRPDNESISRIAGCEDERNLTDAGRAAMAEVHEAIDRIGPEVSEVLASPFCRAFETARIAFGDEEVTEVLASRIDDERSAARLEETRRLLSTSPEAGTVRVLVAHYSNLRDALGVTISEGEAAIFEPHGDGNEPTLIARVPQDQWATVADTLSPTD